MTRFRLTGATFVSLACVALALAQAPSDEETAYARKKFAVLREFPDQLAQLRQSRETFAALPPARQKQIVALERELNRLPSTTQARLQDALDRYNAWLADLPEADRKRVLDAPSAAARLEVVRDLRRAEWMRRQPKSVQAELASASPAKRDARLAQLAQEERRRRAEWAIARRFWDDLAKNKPLPAKLDDFEPAVRSYVSDVLVRLASKEERDRLTQVEGTWPAYPRTLVEIADAHPPALPSPHGPKAIADLPKTVRDTMTKKGVALLKEKQLEKRLKPFEGRFPDFAMRFTGYAFETGWTLPHEWWAYNFVSLQPPMQDFVKKRLEPALDRKESRLLLDAEGKWPEYPEAIAKLARTHHLQPPWFTLPGPRERWDAYRPERDASVAPGMPALPRYLLRDLVAHDFDDLDRHKFKNEIERTRVRSDGEAWATLAEQYFQRYPAEATRLRALDRPKGDAKGDGR